MAKSKYTYEELKAIALNDSETRQAYDEIGSEFDFLKAMIHAGKTQDEVTEIMHANKLVTNIVE